MVLESGDEHRFDVCVIAILLPLLKTFDCGLDSYPEVTLALENLDMGTAAKLSIEVGDLELRDTARQSDSGSWWYWQSMSRDGDRRVEQITSYAGGESTLAGLDVDSGPSTWIDRIVTDAALSSVQESVLTDWSHDPWALGAFAVTRLSWTPESHSVLRRPVGRIVLAGEHIGPYGSMDGAIASGEHAAAQLLNTFA